MTEQEFCRLLADYGNERFDDGALEAGDPCHPTLVKQAEVAARAVVNAWRQMRDERDTARAIWADSAQARNEVEDMAAAYRQIKRERDDLVIKLHSANVATQFCHDNHS